MGRPLKKDVNGVNVIGSAAYGASDEKNAGIRVEFFDTALHTDGAIVKQRGARTYVVTQMANIIDDDLKGSTGKIACTLQATVPAEKGQMRITATAPGGDVYVAKMTKRIVTDFDGNRYKWTMSNYEDSAGDTILVTPVA